MSKLTIPARSQEATPRRQKSLRTLSVTSPARSDSSCKLVTVVAPYINDTFALSPMLRQSVLPDITEIEAPRRTSWWKRLDGSSRDVLEALDTNKMQGNLLLEEFEMEVEKEKQSQSVPESSDNESVASIVVPPRRLFNQKKQSQGNFGKIMGSRKSSGEDHDNTITFAPKTLFNKGQPRNRPVFPAALLNSTNKTINKTVEPDVNERRLFGQAATKRKKNMFADLVLSESEDDSEIQHKVFGFRKNDNKRISLATRNRRKSSLTPSMTTDLDIEDWKLLPSSTMIGNGSEAWEASRIANNEKIEQMEVENRDGTLTEVKQHLQIEENNHNSIESRRNRTLNQTRLNKSTEYNDEFDETLTNENIGLESASKNENIKLIPESNIMNKSQRRNKTMPSEKCKVETLLKENKTIELGRIGVQKKNIDEQTTLVEIAVEDKMAELHGMNTPKEITHEVQPTLEHQIPSNEKETNENQNYEIREILMKDNDYGDIKQMEVENRDVTKTEAYQSAKLEENNHNTSKIRKNQSLNLTKLNKSTKHIDNKALPNENIEVASTSKNQNIILISESMNKSQQHNKTMRLDLLEEKTSKENKTAERGRFVEEINNINEHTTDVEACVEHEMAELHENNGNKEKIHYIEPMLKDQKHSNEKEITQEGGLDKASDNIDAEGVKEKEDENKLNEDMGYIDDHSKTCVQTSHGSPNIIVPGKSRKNVESLVEEEEQANEVIDETAKSSDDTTHPNKKKDESEVKSPEAVLGNFSKDNISFKPIGRSTSFRKSGIEGINLKPSLIPIRESTIGSDGSRCSSTEGSGWDSHRTTRKTLRQTFGIDITQRKSLRALVMEQSAKRNMQGLQQKIERKSDKEESQEIEEELKRDQSERIVSREIDDDSQEQSDQESNRDICDEPDREESDNNLNEHKDGEPDSQSQKSNRTLSDNEISDQEVDNELSERLCRQIPGNEISEQVSEEEIEEISISNRVANQSESRDVSADSKKSLTGIQLKKNEQSDRESVRDVTDEPNEDLPTLEPDSDHGINEQEGEDSDQNISDQDEEDLDRNISEQNEEDLDHNISNQDEDLDHDMSEQNGEDLDHNINEQDGEDSEHNISEQQEEDLDHNISEQQEEDLDHNISNQDEDLDHSISEQNGEDLDHNINEQDGEDSEHNISEQDGEDLDHDIHDQDGEDSDHNMNEQDDSELYSRSQRSNRTERFVFDTEMSEEEIDYELSDNLSRQITGNDISGEVSGNEVEDMAISNRVSDQNESHNVSAGTTMSLNRIQLEEITQKHLAMRLKIREEVLNSHKQKLHSDPFMLQPTFTYRRMKKPEPKKPKQKPRKPTQLLMGPLPKQFLEDLNYKPPKRFHPSNAPWITKRLYKFLEDKLEPKYDYRARVRAEQLVKQIYELTKLARRRDVAPPAAVDELKREMARLNIVTTHFDFHEFFHEFMPREIIVKVNPNVVNKIPMPRNGIFSDILQARPAVDL